MSYGGGDLTEIFVSHPELGERRFAPKANESFTILKGGKVSNDDESGVTGNGQFIDQINNTRWSVEGSIALSVDGEDADFLEKLAESPILGTWTFSHILGYVLQGQGKPVGNPSELDTNTGLATLKVAGPPKLSKIG